MCYVNVTIGRINISAFALFGNIKMGSLQSDPLSIAYKVAGPLMTAKGAL